MLLVCSGNICEDRCLVICCEIRSSIDQFVRFRLTSNGSTTAFEKKKKFFLERALRTNRPQSMTCNWIFRKDSDHVNDIKIRELVLRPLHRNVISSNVRITLAFALRIIMEPSHNHHDLVQIECIRKFVCYKIIFQCHQ
jgi:hypothetical protein